MPDVVQRNVVEEARDLRARCGEWTPPDSAGDIAHALFADAVERQHKSPFWGYTKDVAHLYARAPELLVALCDEVERLRKQLVTTAQDARRDAQAAADEAYWRDKQGDEYGSY